MRELEKESGREWLSAHPSPHPPPLLPLASTPFHSCRSLWSTSSSTSTPPPSASGRRAVGPLSPQGPRAACNAPPLGAACAHLTVHSPGGPRERAPAALGRASIYIGGVEGAHVPPADTT